MPKEFNRTRRVSEVIQRELADIMHRELNDPQMGMLTISEVEVSGDLKNARIYISMLGGHLTHAQLIERLTDATGLLRYHLSQRLTTRVTPRLQFSYDETIEQGMHMDALINSISQGNKHD